MSSIFLAAGHCFLGLRFSRAFPWCCCRSIHPPEKQNQHQINIPVGRRRRKSLEPAEREGGQQFMSDLVMMVLFFSTVHLFCFGRFMFTREMLGRGGSVRNPPPPAQTTNDAGRGCHHLDDDEWLTNKSSCVLCVPAAAPPLRFQPEPTMMDAFHKKSNRPRTETTRTPVD